MADLAKVSIILMTYNRENCVERAIKSALKQTYKNIELVILDDVSQDGTQAICKSYLKDKRVHYYRNEKNLGATLNFQGGLLDHVTGKYFISLSDDDCLQDSVFIEEAVHILERTPSAMLVFGNHATMNFAENKIVSRESRPLQNHTMLSGKDFWQSWLYLQPYIGTCLCRRKQALEVGGFWNCFRGMDMLFILQMALKGDVVYLQREVCLVGVDGEKWTTTLVTTLEGQYLNLEFFRVAASIAKTNGFSTEEAKKWKDGCITHYLYLIFRDYIFVDNGKTMAEKLQELYLMAEEHGDIKLLYDAQSRWLMRLLQR